MKWVSPCDCYPPMSVVAAPAAAPATIHLLYVGCSKFLSIRRPTMIHPCIFRAFSGMIPIVRLTRPGRGGGRRGGVRVVRVCVCGASVAQVTRFKFLERFTSIHLSPTIWCQMLLFTQQWGLAQDIRQPTCILQNIGASLLHTSHILLLSDTILHFHV